MNPRIAKTLLPRFSASGLMVLVIILAFSFVAIVLIPGLELASELADTSIALKFAGQQQRNPALIRASLESMHDRLTNRGYIQESLDQLRDASAKLDAGLKEMNAPRPASWFALSGDTSAKGEPISGKHATPLHDLWSTQQEALQPLLKFTGVPYQDNETTGTVLTEGGKQLERDVTTALRVGRHTIPLLDAELAAIVTDLQTRNARSATELRLVMLTGLLIAIVLGVLVATLLLARQRQDASLREARQQTADILRTVKDGLFLLDEHLVIGASYSSALESLFQRHDFAGLPFESLLKDIVSEKTLATALKFVSVLWSERTKENLVKTINPLGEVEVNFDSGPGKVSTRYLQFEFHRVRVDGKIRHVLVAVSDVSARVDLARELQSSQNQAQAQVDTLLGILHVDPTQLASRLQRRNENDQRGAARAGPRGRRLPQETRHPFQASALGQGRSRGSGIVLH
jgi:two-component system, chemotaxis family, sensor kinase CheA